jgi:iron complex outermembrane receptor protein
MAGASLLALITASGVAHAADAAAAADSGEVSEVIVTGTRQVGIKAADSAAPIQLVGAPQLTRTGAVDLATSLAASVPSLNIQTNGGDASAVHILAALRGLGPDDTLVLVDGKRRHPTSNLAVDGGSVFSGSATTDLNYIPVAAIDHIEVLTDGAAAQYGTDAIAGVINIILKKNASGGTLQGTGGEFYNGQGATGAFSYNQGFNLWDKGFVNLTLEERYHDFTTLGIGDDRVTNASGALLPGLTYPNSNAGSATNFPHVNRLNGDPEYNIYNAFINAGVQVGGGFEAYAFGNYSYNASQHFENYRLPSKVAALTSTGVEVIPYPNGFDPKEKFDETDYSATVGLRGGIAGWNIDLSSTYGGNSTQVYTIDSANADEFTLLQNASATPVSYPLHSFYDGSFEATEWTSNIDVDKTFPIGLASPLNVAFGGEYRRDTYGIGAGEPSSYFGGGAQSFAGYGPGDSGYHSRKSYAAYVDLAIDPINHLHVDVAGRYESYSDFGDTKDGKVTVRYDFSPAFAIRGTIADGFRAPTLAEEFYTGINVGPTSVSGQLPPDSSAALTSGFTPLQPETSINYSVGFVAHPAPDLQITLDAYEILLHSRILNANGFQGLHPYCVPNGVSISHTSTPVILACPAGATAEDVEVSPGVLATLAGQGVSTGGLTSVGFSSFINALNTRTDGIELTANYASDFGDFGHVDWSLGFNYNKTQITKVSALPSAIYAFNAAVGINQTQFLTAATASELTTATPREKVILQAVWSVNRFIVSLRGTIYGTMSQYVNTPPVLQQIGVTGIADLDVGYKVTSHLRVDVGANNLFDTKPPLTPLSSTGQPSDGGRVYNVPYGFAPWGQNGGYYYGRVTYTF